MQRSRAASALVAATTVLVLPTLAHAYTEDGRGQFARALDRGPAWALMAALLGGLLVSLTPCVYPMIAITVSVFGARTASSRARAAALSGIFVLGIARMFTVLGMGAALSGAIFGSALSNRWVISGVSLIFAALSASMFGAFDLALPAPVSTRLASVGGIGFAGAFVLGLVSALVAAPCTGPVLAGILLWIASTHRIVLGTGVMFTFALGLGVPFFVVGTFAVALPKSGAWMLGTKWLFGVVLAVVALYFLRSALPALDYLVRPEPAFVIAASLALGVGVLFAVLHVRSEGRGARYPQLAKPFKQASIAPAVAGAFLLVCWVQRPQAELRWMHSEREALRLAHEEGRPMIIDFGATWCTACGELKTHTFADAAVREEAARFISFNVDATDDEDPDTGRLKDKYGVVGLPTVLILDSQGNERDRFVEYVTPERLLGALRAVN